jgi:hypothetical protein
MQGRVVGDQHHDRRLTGDFAVRVWGPRHYVGTMPRSSSNHGTVIMPCISQTIRCLLHTACSWLAGLPKTVIIPQVLSYKGEITEYYSVVEKFIMQI